MARHFTTAGLLGAGAILAATCAQAQSVADFYRGKTVNVLIGVGVGGEYDLQARLVARHIGKHIPGNPLVVPQNMTGAGGIKMANYLYHAGGPRRHQYRHARQQFSGNASSRRPGRAVRLGQVSLARQHGARWSRPWRCGTPRA